MTRDSITDLPFTPIVFDDGAFPSFYPDGTGPVIPFENYQRLLELAERTNTVIPIAVTTAFIDVNNIASMNLTHQNSAQIVQFLQLNKDRLPVWNHGLTHHYEKNFFEFSPCTNSTAVPEEYQHKHLDLSQEILTSLDLGNMSIFVPPSHCWQWGVTDYIAQQYDIQAIAIRQFEKSSLLDWLKQPRHPYTITWPESRYLTTLYRLGLGIAADLPEINAIQTWKAKQYIQPSNRFLYYLIHRSKTSVKRPHHFFAHIQNLSSKGSLENWVSIINNLKKFYDKAH